MGVVRLELAKSAFTKKPNKRKIMGKERREPCESS